MGRKTESSPPAPFELVFGSTYVSWLALGGALTTGIFLWLLIRVGISITSPYRAFAGIIYLGFFLPLIALATLSSVRGMMFADPKLIFDGSRLEIEVRGQRYEIIDSNWYDLSDESRRKRLQFSLTLERNLDPRDALMNRCALTGGNREIYIKPISFEGGSTHFRQRFGEALEHLNLRET